MPGTPAITPNFDIPRWDDDADDAKFPVQWNASVDQIDSELYAQIRARFGLFLANYQTVFATDFRFTGAHAAGWYRVNSASQSMALSGAASTSSPYSFYLDPAEYAITGYNLRFRMRLSTLTSPSGGGTGRTFTGAIGPLGMTTTENQFNHGSPLTGSTASYVDTGSALTAVSSDFAITSAGLYVAMLQVTFTLASISGSGRIVLERHYVP